MKNYTRDEIIANRIFFAFVLILWIAIFYTTFKSMDEDTHKMLVYNLGPNRTDDCTFISYDKDIFWTDVFMACKVSTLPNNMNNYTLKYVGDYKKHYISRKSDKWCHDITGEYSYTPCEKIFRYRKYFYEGD